MAFQYRYASPEIFASNLTEYTESSEVFAFGVLMAELMLGRPLIRTVDDVLSGLGLPIPASVLDLEKSSGSGSPFCFDPNLHSLVLQCVNLNPTERPLLSQVVLALRGALACARGDSYFWRQLSPLNLYYKARASTELAEVTKDQTEYLFVSHLEHTGTQPLENAKIPLNMESLLAPRLTTSSSNGIGMLPSGLNTLYLPAMTKFRLDWLMFSHLTTLWLGPVSADWTAGNAQAKIVLKLPQTITALGIEDLDLSRVEKEWLPKDLLTLHAGSRTPAQAITLSHLPPALTFISIPGYAGNIPKDGFNPNLTHLSLPSAATTFAEIEHLPTGLKYLDLSAFSDKVPSDKEKLAFLPKLRHLNFRSLSLDVLRWTLLLQGHSCLETLIVGSLMATTAEAAQHLNRLTHPSLTSVTFTQFAGDHSFLMLEMVNLLPNTLRALDLQKGYIDPNNKQNIVNALPRSLLFLSLAQDTSLNDECLSLLPRGLTHLHAPSTTRITHVGIPRLPRGLTYLNIYSAQTAAFAMPWFPPNLTTFTHGPTTWPASDFMFLPPKVR